jgi:hypothetical protein
MQRLGHVTLMRFCLFHVASPCCSAAHERVLCLFGKTVALILIARRVVQRHNLLCPGKSCDCSGLPCRQMVTRLGERRISFEERRFDEKNVSILRKPNDLFESGSGLLPNAPGLN